MNIYKTLSGAEDAIEFSDPINMTYFCLFGGLKREESSYRILVRGRGLHKKACDIHNWLKNLLLTSFILSEFYT